jgi:hypothetical protein
MAKLGSRHRVPGAIAARQAAVLPSGVGRGVKALMPMLLLAAMQGGCGDRSAIAPRISDGVAYGVTALPFRNRWWQFYERGLSWAQGGFLSEAESDLRVCLDQRQTDARRARTYGMHFVQCFAHRELGAVLLAEGRLDESERELRLSIAQEPSAKADLLLERIRQLRDHAAQPPIQRTVEVLGGTANEPVPEVAGRLPEHQEVKPGIATGVSPGAIDIISVQPVAGGQPELAVRGHLRSVEGLPLWIAVGTAAAQRLLTTPDGDFEATIPVHASLRAGMDPATPELVLADITPPPGLQLSIDGPDHDQVAYGGRVWYRYDVRCPDGLSDLTIEQGGGEPLRLPLAGVRSAGMVAVDARIGRNEVRFVVRSHHAEVRSLTRHVTVQPSVHQDRELRATALAIPLQHPWPQAGKPADDPLLLSALSEDGRFRLIDRHADGLLTQELALVEAGYVDRTTAAAAGRRLAARYVISGTLVRGRRDIECFVRLLRSDTSELVCTADAYADHLEGDQAEQPFFTAVAGRLRQLFPVIEALARLDDGLFLLDVGARSGVLTAMRFHVLHDGPALPAQAAGGAVLEAQEPGDEQTPATLVSGSVTSGPARVISE